LFIRLQKTCRRGTIFLKPQFGLVSASFREDNISFLRYGAEYVSTPGLLDGQHTILADQRGSEWTLEFERETELASLKTIFDVSGGKNSLNGEPHHMFRVPIVVTYLLVFFLLDIDGRLCDGYVADWWLSRRTGWTVGSCGRRGQRKVWRAWTDGPTYVRRSPTDSLGAPI
jgi:hypothetical protein